MPGGGGWSSAPEAAWTAWSRWTASTSGSWPGLHGQSRRICRQSGPVRPGICPWHSRLRGRWPVYECRRPGGKSARWQSGRSSGPGGDPPYAGRGGAGHRLPQKRLYRHLPGHCGRDLCPHAWRRRRSASGCRSSWPAARPPSPLDLPSAGSTFKRPVGGYAAALIEQAGLKGTQIGGAAVSAKHAGFVVNLGGATESDVLALIAHVQKRVWKPPASPWSPRWSASEPLPA